MDKNQDQTNRMIPLEERGSSSQDVSLTPSSFQTNAKEKGESERLRKMIERIVDRQLVRDSH